MNPFTTPFTGPSATPFRGGLLGMTVLALLLIGPVHVAASEAEAAASEAGAAASDAAASAAAETDDAAARSPDELVRATADSVLALIEEARDYVDDNPDRFYREVEALLRPAVDFHSFARSVMAAHYRDATPEQRERFAESFKWGLVRTYALALTEFNDGEVVVLPPDRPSRNPKRETVKMEIRTASGDVWPVLYSMAQDDDGRWQVRNLIVNGINMGLTYRNQFNGAVRDPKYRNDLDKVIDDWGDLIEEAEPDLTTPESAALVRPVAGQPV